VSQASSSQTLGAHLLLQQQAISARPLPKEERPAPTFFLSFPFLYFINHILEYARVIFSIVESFAYKALVAFNCGLRFNVSIT
jgi:hypothetical protein